MATGENLRKEIEGDSKATEVVNLLPKDVQIQLRRKKFPFVCKRHFDQTKKDKAATPAASTDLSPLPTKERKLVDFRSKVYVAPLTTVGNLPFRRIMKRFGADITCGEMAMSTSLLQGLNPEWALLKRHPEEDVFGVQIAAGFADQFTRTSEVLESFCKLDFVDVNMGCPLDFVNEKQAGAALMLRENKLRESLLGMSRALSCPFTVKMRTGWDEEKPFAHLLVPKIQSWQIDGLNALMVRTVIIIKYLVELFINAFLMPANFRLPSFNFYRFTADRGFKGTTESRTGTMSLRWPTCRAMTYRKSQSSATAISSLIAIMRRRWHEKGSRQRQCLPVGLSSSRGCLRK